MSKIEFKLTVDQILIVKRQYGEWLYQEESSLDDYFTANPVTLEFDVPSPWRTDIENAPRDGRKIFISDCNGYYYVVYPLDGLDYYTWGSVEYGIFGNNEIAYWMPIPELPKL